MTKNKVSIIVPVYKVEQYLPQCVDSILAQTHQNLEIILIDDGSPDNCGAICDAYAAKDSRIHVIHQKNAGLSAARNAGLDIATGKYIAFVDSDDWIKPETIQTALETYAQNNADLVIFGLESFYEKNFHGPQRCESPLNNELLSPRQLTEKLLANSGWHYVVAWNKLYKREIFDCLRFPADYIHEDEAIFHRVIAGCKTIATISECFYMYRQTNSGIMGSSFSAKRTDALYAFADRLAYARRYHWDSYEQHLAKLYAEKLWEWYHLFYGTENTDKYIKRMEQSLKWALPSILRNKTIQKSHKFYLTLLRLHPQLFWVVYGMIRKIKA